MNNVIEVTGATFQTEVIDRSHEVPVIVDFWAPWCGPCKALGPVLERMAESAAGEWVLAKVNTDDHQQLANDFRIQGIPNVKAFVDGEVVGEFAGVRPEPEIQTWLAGILPSEDDEAFDAAKLAEADGRLDEARVTYEALLSKDTENPFLRAALARLDLAAGDVEAAAASLAAIPDAYYQTTDGELERAWIAIQAAQVERSIEELTAAMQADPADAQSRFEAAMLHAAATRYPDALQCLLEIVARDRAYRDDLGRLAMIRVFEVMGPQSDLVNDWRAQMGRAMY